MKKFLTLSLFLMMMFMFIPFGMKGDIQSQTYCIKVYKLAQSYTEHNKNKCPDTKRLPAYPMICTISQSEGICIAGYTNDFTSYEIWDGEGEMCLASFLEESDFIDVLFSMTGEFQIRFVSEEFLLIGYISTNI